MPRKAQPWYRAGRSSWFIHMNGRQVDLGVRDPNDQARAFEAWRALLEQQRQGEGQGGTVAAKVAEYLERVARRVKAHTVNVYRWLLGKFCDSFGARRMDELTAEQIEDDARRSSWSSSTRNSYLGAVCSFLAWAGVRLRIRKPPKQSAGSKSIVTEETQAIVRTHCRGDWLAVVDFLWETGCRPSECSRLTVEMVDWAAKVARLKEHKTDASGEERVLYFSPRAFEVLQHQRAKYRTGLLFRSIHGARLTTAAFDRKFRRVSKRIGRRVASYSYRHSFISRALAAGESDTLVAMLVGHASTHMIHKFYRHASAMGRQLKDAADRIGRRSA